MRILVPLTGELITFNSGNPDNPVKPIDFTELLPIELTDFSWEALNYDFEAGVVELEITFKPTTIPTKWDDKGKAIESRQEEEDDFQQRKVASESALSKVLREHTIDELYAMSKCSRLNRPFKEK